MYDVIGVNFCRSKSELNPQIRSKTSLPHYQGESLPKVAMSDLGFLPFLFTSHNKHIEKVIYNKVFSGRLEGLLNHYRCTTKAIIFLSPVLSYINLCVLVWLEFEPSLR